jgi:signal transduction histidine kinase
MREEPTMISLADLGVIIAVALACALVVGLLGVAALWLARRSTMLVRLCIVVVTGMVSVVAGMIAIARAMYLSEHDLVVSLYVAGAATLASLGVALVLGRLFARDSDRLRRLAQALGEGEDVTLTAHPRDNSELTKLAAELAATSERLAEARREVDALDASRRELVAWISHDLRTPLAGLRAMAEALEDGLADDPSRFHRQMRSQVDQLSGMVDDLFELSKIHSGTLSLAHEEVSLYDLASDAVADLSLVAEARSVTLVEAGGPGPSVVGDPRELTRVIENLLMNALQHSPPGSVVSVETSEDEHGNAVLTVVDSGGGIAEDDLSQIFRAGWRGTASRTPEPTWGRSAGAGLGLAIVHGLIEAHLGHVSVQNVAEGTRFDVSLPAARPRLAKGAPA